MSRLHLLLGLGLSLGTGFYGCSSKDVSPKAEAHATQQHLADQLADQEEQQLREEAEQMAALANQHASGQVNAPIITDVTEGIGALEPPAALQVEPAADVPPIIEAPEAEESIPVVPEFKPIYFAFDQSQLDQKSEQRLMEYIEWIKTHQSIKIQIEGHADERGSTQYNLALGERRAQTVLKYILKAGLSPKQFSIISFGEERPAAFGTEESVWQWNRRVEFTQM